MPVSIEKGSIFGLGTQQLIKASIPLWEEIFRRYSFKRIIELGTGNGVFSFYLYVACRVRQAEFVTYDRKQVKNPLSGLFPDFEARKITAEIFEHVEEITRLIQRPGRAILFIDAEKAKAFKTFAPCLKTGDLAPVHDWGDEIRWIDVEAADTDLETILDDLETSENMDGPRTKCFMKR